MCLPGLYLHRISCRWGEPGRVARLASLLPLKRGGKPEEVASAIVWLLSAQASYATGTFIDLTGEKWGFCYPSDTGVCFMCQKAWL
ncbi:SDR family oxidoreductase [Pseudoalteromonas sp. OOF1S-7]|uniref:SDR family oxidoreductase n=1 Tax=Pseudoalteromonas sp. OOF1S-7 TaxID=2917757 RepID=UPI001EF4A22B|nr:SDR family oxidoreductase [Pseudoalteromonas sp. OOF1S-7]MCG7535362.1 SDR family oxidoreductase [Pseudoalteromonas sp. OOF1S-7]